MSLTRSPPRACENQITASRELRSERLGWQAAATHHGYTRARMRIVRLSGMPGADGWSFGMHEAEQLAGALEPNWKMLSAARRRRDGQGHIRTSVARGRVKPRETIGKPRPRTNMVARSQISAALAMFNGLHDRSNRNFNTNFSEAEPTSSAMTNLGSLISTGVPQKSVMSIAGSRKKNGGR